MSQWLRSISQTSQRVDLDYSSSSSSSRSSEICELKSSPYINESMHEEEHFSTRKGAKWLPDFMNQKQKVEQIQDKAKELDAT